MKHGKNNGAVLKISSEKYFIQGLIMVTVALYHYKRKNYTGTSRLIEKGMHLSLILGGGAQGSKSLPIPGSKSDAQKCDNNGKDDCRKASKWQLELANIFDEHDFKEEYVGGSVSHYDICACKDGSIVIKEVGQCGKPGPSIPTHGRWK